MVKAILRGDVQLVTANRKTRKMSLIAENKNHNTRENSPTEAIDLRSKKACASTFRC